MYQKNYFELFVKYFSIWKMFYNNFFCLLNIYYLSQLISFGINLSMQEHVSISLWSLILVLAQTDVYSKEQIKRTTNFVWPQFTLDISSTTNDQNKSPISKRSTSTITSVPFLTSGKSTSSVLATGHTNDTPSFKLGKAYHKLNIKSWMILRIRSRLVLVCLYICINEEICPNSTRVFVVLTNKTWFLKVVIFVFILPYYKIEF